MAFGVIPICVNNAGSNKYIVIDKQNGMTVYPKSPNEIAHKVQTICKDPELYNRLQNGAYEYAKKHTLSKEVDRMLDFINQVRRGAQ